MQVFGKSPGAAGCVRLLLILATTLAAAAAGGAARDLSYDQALEIATGQSSRAEIIMGNLEVAERKYFARRVSFYVPEISINGSLPAWESSEQYAFPEGGGTEKVVASRKTLDLNTFIGLDQNLITGGKVNFRAWLRRNDWEYPQASFRVDETKELGSFDLTLEQPVLQPSQPKHELNNRKDDLELARLARTEELAALKKEVAEAYVGALQLSLDMEIAREKLESARLQAEVDSAKYLDEILSEEDWLKSASARLDAELQLYDIESELSQQYQELAILLELESYQDLDLSEPTLGPPLSPEEQERLVAGADRSVPIRKAEYNYRKAKRSADYTASSSGLTGTLSANYSKDAGTVESEYVDNPALNSDESLNLDSWGVKLEFSYPIWDGGASGAEVKASRIEAEKARIELERAQKVARAEIRNLTEGLDVSYRKLSVLQKQIDLAGERLKIAKFRFEDGQISRITYLETSVEALEARKNYLDELKNYLVDFYELEGKFTG